MRQSFPSSDIAGRVRGPSHLNDRRIAHLDALRQQPESAGGYSLAAFERTRSIFVHIPKTGGVSVARALYGGLGAGHLRLGDYEAALGCGAVRDAYTFTFVRNPWDRLFSAYTFLMAGGMNEGDRAWAERVLSGYRDFEAFVCTGLEAVREQIHFVPQVAFLNGVIPDGHGVDLLGFYENLADDFAAVKAIVNPAAILGHENRTDRPAGSYRDAYTPAMIARVGEAYRADIEAFGYVFDGSSLDGQLRRRQSAAAGRALSHAVSRLTEPPHHALSNLPAIPFKRE